MTPLLLVALALADEPAADAGAVAPGVQPAPVVAAPPVAPKAPAAPVAITVHGNVKTFVLGGKPNRWFEFSEDAESLLDTMGVDADDAAAAYGLTADPFAEGVASARLQLGVGYGAFRLDLHWAGSATSAAPSTGAAGFGTGVGLTAPELLPLSWSPDTGDGLTLRHRIDRLVLSAKLPHVDVALGRQAVSFGVGRFFTPLDLVNPFSPATIDTEWKPGVDALRLDAYAGMATKVTAVAAWAGRPVLGEAARDDDRAVLADLVLAAFAQTTVGVTDLGVFAGDIRAEPVFGLNVVSAVGPVGVHAEASLTLPEKDDPFVRAVAGADWRPGDQTTLTGEVYAQSFGPTKPEDYLDALDSPRVNRGELWEAGQLYAALAVAQEITPLVSGNLAVISNVRDPSALLSAAIAWNVADNADVAFGAYAGLGAPPDRIALDFSLDPATGAPGLTAPTEAELADSVNSEFGLYPAMGFVQAKAYF